ncbi:uncharacterized protein G2W53_043577 [Senna tora]|uniref:Uncharacterized protein n=1 Tax=Senna tora TaxID=362788 RepID=A0A834SIY2_9FABA|nr:uncharacterized protein G2W53_043577 [Senna tora]
MGLDQGTGTWKKENTKYERAGTVDTPEQLSS